MPGHNTNAMKCPRVDATAAAETEAYHKTARALLTKLGFDPDNLNKECLVDRRYITPMNYFCCTGNLTMCQYLVFYCGAACRKINNDGWFPLFYAAANGHVEICQWLVHHCGAHEDIRRVTMHGRSPLLEALRYYVKNGNFDIVQCCILNGALLAPRDDGDSGGIDDRVMRKDFTPVYSPIEGWQDDVRLRLLAWAQNVVTNHDNVTLLSASSPPLVIFDGKSGILKLVVDYVGNPTPEELRLFRRLLELLPVFIADVPFVLRP